MEFTYIGNQDKKDVRLAGSFANGAFVTANSSASFANAAFARANAAFAQANTGGGGGSGTPITIYSDVFVANGATTTFNLSTTPTSENYIIAVVDGITQLRSTYTVTGNVVAFDTTFENGANVEITTISGGGALDPYAANTANAAYATANAAFLQANNSTDTWVRTQANNAYDQANTGASFANGAFSQSNNASSFANGSFVTANSAASFANSAFDRANSGYNVANTGSSFANGAFVTANSASNFANGSFVTANSAASFANGAFLRANSGYDVANSGASFSNGAFTQANTAVDLGTAAFIQANAAFLQANNSTDTWVRTQANNAYDTANSGASFANGAFVTANSSALFANAAFTTANSAATFANAAFITANASYNAQNTTAEFANGAFATANLKFNTSGGTISGDVSVTGNLSVLGNTFSTSATQIVANDTLFIMGTGNYSGDVLDIGFAAHYNNGINAHTGLIRDSGSKEWQLFEEYTPEVGANNSIDINHASFKIATLQANLKSTTITIKGIDLLPHVNNAYDKANSGSSFANGAFSQSNNASSFANGAFVTANSGAAFANAAFSQANSNYTSAVTKLNVTNSGASAYLIDQYSGNNPSIYVSAGETISFNLDVSGHPFLIRQSSGGTNTSDGLTHISSSGVISTGSGAQGKESGVLFWKVPFSLVGSTFVYQCQYHAGMVGNIVIQQPSSFVASNTTLAFAHANDAFLTANSSYASQNTTATFANAAFVTANAAASFANGSFVTANASYVSQNTTAAFANAAFDRANAAFNAANTGSSGGGTQSSLTHDTFTANGSSSTFNLSTAPTDETYTLVNIDGVLQLKSSYTLSGSTITLSETPESGVLIDVTTLGMGLISSQDPFARAQANAAFDAANNTTGSSIAWYIANANTTMVASSGYFVDTSNGPKTMTLPTTATLGDTIRINDLAGTFSANNLTINRNSHKIQGNTNDLLVNVDQSSFGLIYSNSTYGWKVMEL